MKFGSETPTPITSTFTFSPVNLATLGATEYTLVGVTADRSGSVREAAVAKHMRRGRTISSSASIESVAPIAPMMRIGDSE